MAMDVMTARRIVHFVDDMHMSFERLASQLDCDEQQAQTIYMEARSIVMVADARAAVNKLMELAKQFNTTTDELVRLYA